jgi:AcrR family transcriptional regulator
MSGNAHPPRASIDRRVRRTRDRLGDALVELVQEKPFEEITVQKVLERAEVGRSTFYEHYRDKDDLFQSDIDEFLELFASMISRSGEKSERILPVREFVSHVGENQKLHDAIVASGKMHDFMELAQGHFARGIEGRFAEIPRTKGMDAARRAAYAQAFAGACLSLVTSWMRSKNARSPQELDDLFHSMVWSGIGAGETSKSVGAEKIEGTVRDRAERNEVGAAGSVASAARSVANEKLRG